MANIRILNETFVALGTNAYGDTVGTVKIDLGFRRVVEAKAYVSQFGTSVAGFVGRYRTSPKPWIASVYGEGEKLSVNFGRDDRSGRFNKQNAIAFEPETYAALSNPKVWEVA